MKRSRLAMTERTVSKRQAAREHALATGGVPFDPHPGYSTFFVRACVERGSAAPLDWLCRVFSERETDILETWCRLAFEAGNWWAWREVRTRLEGLVMRGEAVPAPLRRFALVAPPSRRRGPAPEWAQAMMTEFIVRVMAESGFIASEVNVQLAESYPSPGTKDRAATFRDRRRKGRPFVAAAFEESSRGGSSLEKGSRPVVLDYDWGKPIAAAAVLDDDWVEKLTAAAVVLLTSGWPAFALGWELWPSRRDEHLALWSERAKTEAWCWDELQALWNHAVYCGWSLPARLREVVSILRPSNPPGSSVESLSHAFAIVEVKLAEVVRSEPAARMLVAQAFEQARRLDEASGSPSLPADFGFKLDDSSVRRRFSSGRKRLKGFVASTGG